jgi:hypothetical protein
MRIVKGFAWRLAVPVFEFDLIPMRSPPAQESQFYCKARVEKQPQVLRLCCDVTQHDRSGVGS